MLLEHLLSLSERSVWIIGILVVCLGWLYYLWSRLFSLQGLPSSIPWVRAEHSILKRGIASWKSLLGLRELLIEGYENVSIVAGPAITNNDTDPF